jgi:hypothetical protein
MTDGGSYTDPANWNPAGVPTATDDAFIVDNKLSNLSASADGHQLYVGGTLDHGGTTVGNGVLNQTAGDLRLVGAQSWMVVGDKADVTGTYNLSGGTMFLEDDFVTIGQHGTGLLNVSGNARMNVRGLNFGRWGDPGRGTGTLKDSAVISTRAGGFNVGVEGIGTFTQEGGTLNVGEPGVAADYNHWAFIGGHDNTAGPRTGTYNISGGVFNSAERIQIAQGGGSTGTFNQTGGEVNVGTRLVGGAPGPEGFLEVGQGGLGTYNLSAGTLNVVRSVVVGSWAGGNGRLSITGGTINMGEAFQVARGSTNAADNAHPVAGLVDQQGGVVNAGWAEIGTSRLAGQTFVGTYRLSNGELNTQFEVVVGRNGGEGVFEMSGGTVNTGRAPASDTGAQRTFIVGRGAKGTFTMSGGTINVPQAFMLSGEEGGVMGFGTGTQTGGTINSQGWISIGQNNTATYTLTGGNMVAAGDFNIGDVVAQNTPYVATLNLGGTGTAVGNKVFVGKAGLTTGVVNQTGGQMIVGAGGLVLGDQAGSTGAYNLQGGLLDLQGNNMMYGAGTGLFVMTGGELRGANSTNFALNQQGGKLSVGNGVGRTTVNGGYQLGAPGVVEVALNGLGAGTGYDQLAVTGDVSLGGSLSVLSGFDATAGDQFLILDNQGTAPIAGNFLGLPEGATFTAGSEQYRISYLGGSGNDVVLTNVVPEPATLGLGMLGGIYFLSRRRAR